MIEKWKWPILASKYIQMILINILANNFYHEKTNQSITANIHHTLNNRSDPYSLISPTYKTHLDHIPNS